MEVKPVEAAAGADEKLKPPGLAPNALAAPNAGAEPKREAPPLAGSVVAPNGEGAPKGFAETVDVPKREEAAAGWLAFPKIEVVDEAGLKANMPPVEAVLMKGRRAFGGQSTWWNRFERHGGAKERRRREKRGGQRPHPLGLRWLRKW